MSYLTLCRDSQTWPIEQKFLNHILVPITTFENWSYIEDTVLKEVTFVCSIKAHGRVLTLKAGAILQRIVQSKGCANNVA